MTFRCAVVGAGSWGTTVANLLAANAPTVLWARDPALVDEITTTGTNPRYLPGAPLNPLLVATADLAEAVEPADLVVMGVPSHGFRRTFTDVASLLAPGVPVVSLAKGLEQGTRLRMTELVAEISPDRPRGVLTGPNLAREIMAGHAAASVLAMDDLDVADELQELFCGEFFRVYTNPDLVGCELGGALKNVMAIASGMADGLGTGDNTRAAVITRGLAELSRLGTALGGQPLTFSGLAGMGDLVATCISPQSRNRHVGQKLGEGQTLEQIVAELHMVAEGVKAAPVVMELARELGVEMPIAEEVDAVLHHGRTAAEAYRGLLGRRHRHEMHGLLADAGGGPGPSH